MDNEKPGDFVKSCLPKLSPFLKAMGIVFLVCVVVIILGVVLISISKANAEEIAPVDPVYVETITITMPRVEDLPVETLPALGEDGKPIDPICKMDIKDMDGFRFNLFLKTAKMFGCTITELE